MFSERLKELRKKKGMTQIQFAEVFNISSGTIAMWETGKRKPDLETIKNIAEFFDVSVDYLIGNKQEKEPEGETPFELTQDEYEVLQLFRKATSKEREYATYILKNGEQK